MKNIILLLGSTPVLQDFVTLVQSKYPTLAIFQASYSRKLDNVNEKNFCQLKPGNEVNQVEGFMENKGKVVAIYNRSDILIKLHGQLVDYFEAPGPSAQSITWFRDKAQMHELMVANQLSQYRPETQVVSFAELIQTLNHLTYPVVVKPFIGAKSRGITTVGTKNEIKVAVKNIQQHFQNNKTIQHSRSDEQKILIEKFVVGKQLTPTCYVDHKGKLTILSFVDVMTAKELGQNHMQLVYRTTPSRYSEFYLQKIYFILQKLIHLSGLRSTFLHPEFIVAGKELYLIELNIRMGGFRAELTKYAFGVNLDLIGLQLALCEEVEVQVESVGSCTACEVWDERKGRIQSVMLPKSKYIVGQKQYFFPGDVYTPPPFAQSALARFFVRSEADDSLRIAKQLRKKVAIEFE